MNIIAYRCYLSGGVTIGIRPLPKYKETNSGNTSEPGNSYEIDLAKPKSGVPQLFTLLFRKSEFTDQEQKKLALEPAIQCKLYLVSGLLKKPFDLDEFYM